MSAIVEDPLVSQAAQAENADWNRLKSYHGEAYYGLPAVKPSYYGWEVAVYFLVGGLASAAQFLATAISLFGRREDRPVIRAGRYIALAGALASPGLLIADLHTPQRWYNMLRIFRRTSPMSIGSWALTTFGLTSGIAAVGQGITDLFGWRIGEWIARIASLPAALAGGVVSIYTGTLLASTSNPLWSSAFPYLSSLFASSAATTAAAALTVSAPDPATRRRLTGFAWISGAAELVFALLVERKLRDRGMAHDELYRKPIKGSWQVGVIGLGIAAPLALHTVDLLTRGKSRRISGIAALLTLAGGFLLRAVLIFSGNAASKKPQHYFRVTQPGLDGQGSREPGRAAHEHARSRA
jgi:formate-dependent nitrite reductase membrane component NrfD